MASALQSVSKVVGAEGGCNRCASRWNDHNSLAHAANHHRQSGHPTWAKQTVKTEYGGKKPKSDQGKLI